MMRNEHAWEREAFENEKADRKAADEIDISR